MDEPSERLGPPGWPYHNLTYVEAKAMIYIIQAGTDGPIKIGYSKDANTLARRIMTIQTSCAHKIKLRHSEDGDKQAEKAAHKALSQEKLSGEWFRFDKVTSTFIAHSKKYDIGVAITKISRVRERHENQPWARSEKQTEIEYKAVLLKPSVIKKILRSDPSDSRKLERELGLTGSVIKAAREIHGPRFGIT